MGIKEFLSMIIDIEITRENLIIFHETSQEKTRNFKISIFGGIGRPVAIATRATLQ